VDARNEAVAVKVNGVKVNGELDESRFDLEAIFQAQYARIARVIARVIRDPGRAEELAVEVFLKWSRNPLAQGSKAEGWLHRTAARMALDELRKQSRRSRHERWPAPVRRPPTPEEIHSATQEQDRVRGVLGGIAPRHAELLVLRSQGFNYEELAATLELNPASVGTLLSRAQQAFRKEYLKRYGKA
jgi:RNA polymerase sigma-70 factor, ECF subfamily